MRNIDNRHPAKTGTDGFSLDRFEQSLGSLAWAAPGATLKVAFSGGMDSHVLLHALALLRDVHGWRLSVIHVNHGLHPQADSWAGHCQQVCADLHVPITTERVRIDSSTGPGPEAAARLARYECLKRHIGPSDVLLTAHHQDDQAETLLLQLLRGAGVHGMSGMPAVAGFSEGLHSRPFLEFRRVDLKRYATDHKLVWIEDSSNYDTRLARNYLRHRVLPLLENNWPAAIARLAQSATHAAEAASILDEVAAQDLSGATVGEKETLSIPALCRFRVERRNNLLRYWIRQQHGRSPTTLVVRQVQAHIDQAPKTCHAAVPLGRAEICRYRDRLYYARAQSKRVITIGNWDMKSPLSIPGSHCIWRTVASVGSGLSQKRLHGRQIAVRLRNGGERLRIHGSTYHRTLKKLLQESGIPPWRRYELPLMYVDGELAAVGDRWISDAFAAAPGEPGLVLLVERMN